MNQALLRICYEKCENIDRNFSGSRSKSGKWHWDWSKSISSDECTSWSIGESGYIKISGSGSSIGSWNRNKSRSRSKFL